MKNLYNKHSIIFLCVGAVLLMMLCVSLMWTGLPLEHYVPQRDDVVATLPVDSATEVENYQVTDDGMVAKVDEEKESSLIYEGLDTDAQYVAIHFANPVEDNVTANVRIEADGEINDSELDMLDARIEKTKETLADLQGHAMSAIYQAQLYSLSDLRNMRADGIYSDSCTRLSEYLVVELPQTHYTAMRISLSGDNVIQSIDLHTNAPTPVAGLYPKTGLRICLGLAMAMVLWFVLAFVEYKWKISNWFVDKLQGKPRSLLIYIGMAAVSLLVGGVISFLSNGLTIIWQKTLFIAVIVMVIMILLRFWNQREYTVEKTLVACLFVIGMAMIWISPLGHTSWDEETHYAWAMQSSVLYGSTGISQADYDAMSNNMPYAGFDYEEQVSMANERGDYVVSYLEPKVQLFYLPAGMAIAVSKLFRLPFFLRFNLGRMAELIVYLLCVYFGMTRLKSGKMILGVIAAFPTAMYLATNYSYDYWVNGFILLGMAYYVGICQDDVTTEISTKDAVVMCGAMALGCLPKQVYAPILVLPILLYFKKNKGKKKSYYIICILVLIVISASLFMRTSAQVTGTGDARMDNTDSAGQVRNILSHPVWYAGVLIRFLLDYVNPLKSNMVSDWAYLGVVSGGCIILLLLFFTAITDKEQYEKHAYPIISRIYVVIMFVGEVAIIATALYVSYSPLGSTEIMGCQPRYMIPLMYPLASIAFGRGIPIKSKITEKVYNSSVMLPLVVVLLYNVYQAMLCANI